MVTQYIPSNEYLLFILFVSGLSPDSFNKYVNKAINEWTQCTETSIHSKNII
jgi:hypothetical protein